MFSLSFALIDPAFSFLAENSKDPDSFCQQIALINRGKEKDGFAGRPVERRRVWPR